MTKIIEREPTEEEENFRKETHANFLQQQALEVEYARHAAYKAPGGSDAIFMKWQREEATKEEWLEAVQAIKDAYPYPVKEKAKKK
jgi:hypothetical protein